MSDWQTELDQVHADALDREIEPADWQGMQQRTSEVTASLIALDAVGITIDMLHDMSIDADRDAVVAAFAHGYPNAYGAEWAISDLADFDLSKLERLHHSVKGFALELEVNDAIDAGMIAMPEGASGFRLADRGAEAVDGYFIDEEGAVVEAIQIKATTYASYLSSTLAKNPDIPIYANTEAAELIAHTDLNVIDTHLKLTDVFPADAEALLDTATTSMPEILDELLPQVTLALVGAGLAVAYFTGKDMDVARRHAATRAGRATAMSATGAALAAITGLEAARFAVAGTFVSVALAENVVRANVDPTLSRINTYRDVLDGLGLAPPAAAAVQRKP